MLHLSIHDYPLNEVYDGTMLGNGVLGVFVWGAEHTLKVTIGCSQTWDHRGGMSWTAKQNYKDIHAALLANNAQKIQEIFATDTENIPGQPRRPSIIPVGRMELTLPDNCVLLRNELCLDDGDINVVYRQDTTEKHAHVRLDMTSKGSFAILCEDVTDVKVSASYDLTGNEMKNISFEAPEKFKSGSWHGFIQKMPVDKPFGLFANHAIANQITGAFIHLDSVKDIKDALKTLSPIYWDKLVSGNHAWWGKYWNTVPKVNIDNPRLEAIYAEGLFKFGSMTAPDGYPAGLQGAWIEDHALPPWSGDYHFNINVQMCYWPAYRSGQFQNLRPMFDMVWGWREQLRQNAKYFIGIDDGYMLPHAVDDHCVCMGSFWTGTIDHACAAWIAQMMFDYIDYTGDMDYLKDVVFDFMRGTMRVFEEMLEKKPDGSLSLPVTVSPEYRGAAMNAWGANASFQLAAVHRLADNLLKASALLKQKPKAIWKAIQEKLPKASLMPCGNSQEIALWDGLILEESHRHHSHLAALCPFDTIDPDDPAWRDIVKNSQRRWISRGMSGWSGWCMPWAAMLNNRFNNGQMAELILEMWQRCFLNPGGGSLHDSAFSGFSLLGFGGGRHIIQLDACMGAVTAVQDMLLHSRQGVIHVLAGASPLWKYVDFKDMPAPGGFRVSVSHKRNGKTTLTVKATRDHELNLVLHVPGKSAVTYQQAMTANQLFTASI